MATFAKASFNASLYAAWRPTYPRQLFEYIFKYHSNKLEGRPSPRWDTAVDLGCGTGQATLELTQYKRVVGVDTSAPLLDKARAVTTESLGADAAKRFEYFQSPAESLLFLEDGSVDLIVSAQAAHWLDWGKMWPEAARVMRPGGSMAFWIYSEFRLAKYPDVTPLITDYAQGTDPVNSVGPYWEQPGRNRLVNHLLDIPPATEAMPDKFYDWQRVFFTGNHYPHLPSPLPVILRKTMTWQNLQEYLRTWSSLHTYH
ncbi:S-adenosyl-L-methionine-dependent methyltransferase, partial [Gloeophyllum trabeum ATCC 11539]